LEKEKTLISVELVAKVEEEACRLARETAGGGQGKVGCDQERVNGFSVNFACDCFVVAGGAIILHDGAVVGSKPEKTEDSCVHLRVGGSEVVDGEVRLVYFRDFREMIERRGSVADGNNGAGVKSSVGDKIVVWRWWVLRSAERAGVDDGTLEFAT
jgi:hypothetical protein